MIKKGELHSYLWIINQHWFRHDISACWLEIVYAGFRSNIIIPNKSTGEATSNIIYEIWNYPMCSMWTSQATIRYNVLNRRIFKYVTFEIWRVISMIFCEYLYVGRLLHPVSTVSFVYHLSCDVKLVIWTYCQQLVDHQLTNPWKVVGKFLILSWTPLVNN